jgi:hypothetical protein
MNDVKDLLELALAGEHDPYQGQEIDAAGDLARGRRLLRRRRLTAIISGSGAAAGIAAVALGVNAAASPARGPGPAAGVTAPGIRTSSPAPRPAHPARARSIALVSYNGRQIPGYQVAKVPRGWVIQGGNAYALVIAPRGDKDTNISSFLGKIVVMLKSTDEPVPTHGHRVPVSGRPGFLRDQGIAKTLTYQDSAGAWVDIQVPSSLGWHGRQFAQFAAGVQVLGNAQSGHG